LPDSPQRRRAEFIRSRGALSYPIRQRRPHMMEREVRK
jgi:hypothetical protein